MTCTWYGEMPPVQLSSKLVPSKVALSTIGGAGKTTKFIVAVVNNADGSATRTTKALVPALSENGVPARPPLPATLSQAGPLTLAKVMVSPFGSLALPANVPAYDCPALADGAAKGLLTNAGGRLVTP